jgi:hypothetical protein
MNSRHHEPSDTIDLRSCHHCKVPIASNPNAEAGNVSVSCMNSRYIQRYIKRYFPHIELSDATLYIFVPSTLCKRRHGSSDELQDVDPIPGGIATFCQYSHTAQTCWNASTAIDSKPFPPLIETTTEDLIRGLETNLFTSVDFVSVYI